MTWDHALLTSVWTIYIFIGSYLKDERLAFYVGESYRRYQEQVVGYPLLYFGPLGRRKCLDTTTADRRFPAEEAPTQLNGDAETRFPRRVA
jgi:hypothetical protein